MIAIGSIVKTREYNDVSLVLQKSDVFYKLIDLGNREIRNIREDHLEVLIDGTYSDNWLFTVEDKRDSNLEWRMMGLTIVVYNKSNNIVSEICGDFTWLSKNVYTDEMKELLELREKNIQGKTCQALLANILQQQELIETIKEILKGE